MDKSSSLRNRVLPLLGALALFLSAANSYATVSPPTIAVQYGSATVTKGGTTAIVYTLTNLNPSTTLTGIVLRDYLGTGTSSPGLEFSISLPSSTCSIPGSATINTNTFTANLSLAPGETCSYIGGTVTGVALGVQDHATDIIGSTESGPGATSNHASVTVVTPFPPTVTAAFSKATLALGESTGFTYTISNPNVSTTLTGVQFVALLGNGTSSPGLNFVVSLPTFVCKQVGVESITSLGLTINSISLAPGQTCTTTTGSMTAVGTGTEPYDQCTLGNGKWPRCGQQYSHCDSDRYQQTDDNDGV